MCIILPTAPDVYFLSQTKARSAFATCNSLDQMTDHVADVTRGILSSSAILDSSIGILDKCAGGSSHSSVRAATVDFLTSPPKYRDKSHKWVACSMMGPPLDGYVTKC